MKIPTHIKTGLNQEWLESESMAPLMDGIWRNDMSVIVPLLKGVLDCVECEAGRYSGSVALEHVIHLLDPAGNYSCPVCGEPSCAGDECGLPSQSLPKIKTWARGAASDLH